MNIYYSPLKGISNIFDYTLNNDIQDGLVEYWDWALLDIGNYFNVTLGETAPNGLDYSELRMATDDHYASGQVWEGFRKNWVWQSGLDPGALVGTDNENPGITGVYVDSLFKPITSVDAYAHHIDYANGRVIFDTPLPTGALVQAEFSYKHINVTYADNVPWLRQVQVNTHQPDSTFDDVSSGEWDTNPESRLQLPAIAIEIVPKRTFKGYQLGGGQWVYTDVLFHCIAEDKITRNALVDMVSFQNDKNVRLFNSNAINTASGFPLDYRGVPVPSALRYPDLVENYDGGELRMTKTVVSEMYAEGNDIFGAVVRVTTEGIKSNI